MNNLIDIFKDGSITVPIYMLKNYKKLTLMFINRSFVWFCDVYVFLALPIYLFVCLFNLVYH